MQKEREIISHNNIKNNFKKLKKILLTKLINF